MHGPLHVTDDNKCKTSPIKLCAHRFSMSDLTELNLPAFEF